MNRDSSLPRKGMAALCAGVIPLAGVYVVGLLAIIIAGVLSPNVHIAKEAIFSAPTGITSASADYQFPMSGYKRSHQSIVLSVRTNVPSALQGIIDGTQSSRIIATDQFNITVYGSPQPEGLWSNCPAGCISCPDGDESDGLSCTLLKESHSGSEEFTCEGGEEWCSWIFLYSIDFTRYTTYYWVVERESSLDEVVASSEVEEVIAEGLEEGETEAVAQFNDHWEQEFQVVFVSQWWTNFELTWYYVWICATLLVMFAPKVGFFTVSWTEGTHWRDWRPAQKWSGVLLVALLFFNNPFFAAQIYSSAQSEFFMWYSVASALLVTLILMCWMDRLFDMGRDHSFPTNPENERLARTAMWMLSTLLFIDYTIVMIQLRELNGDPRQRREYPAHHSTGEQLLNIICFVYCGWILALGCRAWWKGGGDELLRGAGLPKFLMGISIVTLLILVPSIVMKSLSCRIQGGLAFCVAHGAVNLYVLMLALCDPPQKDTRDHPVPGGIGLAWARSGVHSGANVRAAREVPRIPEGEENASAREQRTSSWWKGAARPKIADSSVWEDISAAAPI